MTATAEFLVSEFLYIVYVTVKRAHKRAVLNVVNRRAAGLLAMHVQYQCLYLILSCNACLRNMLDVMLDL